MRLAARNRRTPPNRHRPSSTSAKHSSAIALELLRAILGFRDGFAHAAAEASIALGYRGEQQLVLALEVVTDTADRRPSRLSDVPHGGALEPLVRDRSQRRGDQLDASNVLEYGPCLC